MIGLPPFAKYQLVIAWSMRAQPLVRETPVPVAVTVRTEPTWRLATSSSASRISSE